MTVHLNEGQDFSHFTLLSRSGENDLSVTWLALDRELGERVSLTVFKVPFDDSDVSLITARIDKTKGLIHPRIIRTLEFDQVDNTSFVCQQQIQRAVPYNPDDTTLDQWLVFQSLIDTIIFAHDLGFAHGQLHPGNLLIDDSGQLFVNGFSMPPTIATSEDQNIQSAGNYLSSEIKQGKPADPADDVYSIGCHIYRALTGQEWQVSEPFKPGVYMPAEVGAVLESMLAPSAYDRTRDLKHVREVMAQCFYEKRVNDKGVTTGDDTFHVGPGSFTKSGATMAGAGSDAAVPVSRQLQRKQRQVPVSIIAIALLVIISLAGFVFIYLPDIGNTLLVNSDELVIPDPVSEQGTTKSGTAQTRPLNQEPRQAEERAPVEIARIELAMTQGKELASQVIRLQVELEDLGVAMWAGESFEALVSRADSGDELYRAAMFQEALESYSKTKAALDQLKASAPGILEREIERGDVALSNGASAEALEAFSIAIAIEPDNASLRGKLERAENLDQVQSQVRAARQSEMDGDLGKALRLFEQAKALDSLWQPAVQGVERIQQAQIQRQFDDAMSTAFSALTNKDFIAAKTSFEEASKILPDSPEPEDGMLQIELIERLEQISELKQLAEDHVAAERWKEAIDGFKQALELDASLVFASQGLEQSERRLSLDTRLQMYLDDPTLMADDLELNAAKQTIADASRIDNPSGTLLQQINDLSRLISVARVPLDITIQSDNRTEVTVYRVQHLGKLSSATLTLNPGTYTIVGKRRGYRDVQHNLRLLAGMSVEPIYISCIEKI